MRLLTTILILNLALLCWAQADRVFVLCWATGVTNTPYYVSNGVTNAVPQTDALVVTFEGTNKVYETIEAYMARTGSFHGKDWVFSKISISYPVSGIRTWSSDSVYIAVPKRGRDDAVVTFAPIDPTKIKDL